MHAMNKHEKNWFIVVKRFKGKGPWKWFGHFWFFNHSLRWFLMVSPKDGFTLLWINFNSILKKKSMPFLTNHGMTFVLKVWNCKNLCLLFVTFAIFNWIKIESWTNIRPHYKGPFFSDHTVISNIYHSNPYMFGEEIHLKNKKLFIVFYSCAH